MNTWPDQLQEELKSITSSPPPASKRKVKAVTSLAIKYYKYYDYVAFQIEKFISSAGAPYTLSGLYLLDSIVKIAQRELKTADFYTNRFGRNITSLLAIVTSLTGPDKEKAFRLLQLWVDKKTFPLQVETEISLALEKSKDDVPTRRGSSPTEHQPQLTPPKTSRKQNDSPQIESPPPRNKPTNVSSSPYQPDKPITYLPEKPIAYQPEKPITHQPADKPLDQPTDSTSTSTHAPILAPHLSKPPGVPMAYKPIPQTIPFLPPKPAFPPGPFYPPPLLAPPFSYPTPPPYAPPLRIPNPAPFPRVHPLTPPKLPFPTYPPHPIPKDNQNLNNHPPKAFKNLELESGDNIKIFNKTLYVGNIPTSFNANYLEGLLSSYGKIKIKYSKNCAFVSYETRTQAENAKDKLNGMTLSDQSIKIGWAKDKLLQKQLSLEDKYFDLETGITYIPKNLIPTGAQILNNFPEDPKEQYISLPSSEKKVLRSENFVERGRGRARVPFARARGNRTFQSHANDPKEVEMEIEEDTLCPRHPTAPGKTETPQETKNNLPKEEPTTQPKELPNITGKPTTQPKELPNITGKKRPREDLEEPKPPSSSDPQ